MIETSSSVIVLLYLVILPNAVWRFFGMLAHAAQLWSIGIEEQFYLEWPALMRCAERPVVAMLAVLLFFPGATARPRAVASRHHARHDHAALAGHRVLQVDGSFRPHQRGS